MIASQIKTEPLERFTSVRAVVLNHNDLTDYGWEFVKKLLSRYCDREDAMSTPESLVESIKHDSHQLWLLIAPGGDWAGAMVTEMSKYPNGKTALSVSACATLDTELGKESFRDISDALENFARKNDVDVIRIEGRKGWGRLLPDYTEVSRTIVKVVE